MTNPAPSSGLTFLGKLLSLLLIVGLVALGAWIVLNRAGKKGDNNAGPVPTTAPSGNGTAQIAANFDTSKLTETKTSVPRLDAPAAYVPQNNILDIELSEYAGYAGLIAANGGLEPNDKSEFAKHGFKVRIKISEEESWSALNSGKMAASATTADVLAVYGRQFQVVVPAQIGYSRGADGIMVRSEIKKLNDLKGKTVSAAQFTEADFLVRYLANEAGIGIKMLADLKDEVDPEKLNLIYCEDGLAAGEFFINAVNADAMAIAGVSTWAPMTTEIPAKTSNKARLLVSNRNLLMIADILVVNKGFAEKSPQMVGGLVEGLLAGNKLVRDNPESQADVIGKAFKWDRAKTLAQLKQVHLSNLPEQLAFFGGTMTQGGSFASIYQSAVLAYGDLTSNAPDSERFLALDALKMVQEAGTYREAVAAITPLAATSGAPSESDPILSKDIRFLFQPNLAELDMTRPENLENLKAIRKILEISPGSRVQLVGHVDDSKIPEFRANGGEARVRTEGLNAMDLSKRRAEEIRNQLIARERVDAKRLEPVGRGWTQPLGKNSDANRRVEVQWYTIE